MDPHLEDAGTLITAGLAARELDAASVPASGDAPAAARCANCGAALTGRYCRECGQAAHLHRSLLHLGEEVLHGVVHFDAKGWRTLPLLIARPGRLTRRYIDGERTRYVSPLALFLFCVFLMYAVLSLTAHGPSVLSLSETQRSEVDENLHETLKEQQAALAQAQAQLERARARGDADDIEEAQQELSSVQVALTATRKTASVLSKTLGRSPAPPGVPAAASAPESWQSQLSHTEVHTGSAWLDARLHRALQNPELFLYKVKTTAYKWSFMLIPISLPLIWLMFIGRPGIAMYDHAVFALYSLSFMALLFTVVMIAGALGVESIVGWLIVLMPPLHMYRQLKGTYGLTRMGAVWRTLALLAIAGSAFVVFLVLIAALAL